MSDIEEGASYVLGTCQMVYLDGERTLRLPGELCVGDTYFIIFRTMLVDWDPPHNDGHLSQGDVDAIISKIVNFWARKNLKIGIM